MDYEDEDNYHIVEFIGRSYVNGVTSNATRRIEGEETYRELAQQFVYFLQAMGYNYIHGITLHGETGKDLHTTDF